MVHQWWVRFYEPHSNSWVTGCCQVQFCVGPVQAPQLLWDHVRNNSPEDAIWSHCPWLSSHTLFPPLLLQHSLDFRGADIAVLFRAKNSTVPRSQYLEQPWVFILSRKVSIAESSTCLWVKMWMFRRQFNTMWEHFYNNGLLLTGAVPKDLDDF